MQSPIPSQATSITSISIPEFMAQMAFDHRARAELDPLIEELLRANPDLSAAAMGTEASRAYVAAGGSRWYAKYVEQRATERRAVEIAETARRRAEWLEEAREGFAALSQDERDEFADAVHLGMV